MVAGWPALGGRSGVATWPGYKPQGMFFFLESNKYECPVFSENVSPKVDAQQTC